MSAILTKTVKAGTITAEVALSGTDLVVTYNGDVVSAKDRAIVMPPVTVAGITFRHILRESKLVLTEDEYRAIEAAQRDASRNRPRTLREQRAAIVHEIGMLRREQEDEHERRHDRQDMTAWSAKYANEPSIQDLGDRLAAFDAEHPEVIASIQAERAAKAAANVERAQWM